MDEADKGGTEEDDANCGNELDGGVYDKDAGRGAICDGGKGATLNYLSAQSAETKSVNAHRYSRSSRCSSVRTIGMISRSDLRHCFCVCIYICVVVVVDDML